MALDKLTKVQSVGISSFIQVVGVVTATGGFVGDLTGNVTGNITGTTSNASGATGDFSIADKIVHTGDTNTAIRFPAADTVTVETAGSEALRITSTGQQQSHAGYAGVGINTFASWARTGGAIRAEVGYNAVTTDYMYFGTGTNHPLALRINNSNALYIKNDANRSVGIGTDNPSYLVDAHTSSGNAQLRVKSGGDLAQIILESTDTSGNSQINFADADSNNIGMLQYFHSDNHMEFTVNGSERFRIHSSGVPQFTTTGTQYPAASVPAFVVNSNGDHALVLNNQNTTDPRGLFIYQDQDVNNGTSYFLRARAGGTDRAHLYSNGTLQLHSGNLKLASGNGIDFSATGDGSGTVVSELFDDYEEGTFLPTVEWSGTSATLSGGTYGRYTKIGNTVIINFRIIQTARNATSGSIRMYGLPFAEGSTAAFNHGMVQVDSGGNMPSGAGSMMMYIANTSIRFLYQTNIGHNDLDASHCVDGTAFYGFATYFTS